MNTPHDEVLILANNKQSWLINIFVISIVLFQALIFIKIAFNYSSKFGITKKEINKAFKSAAIATIGPALSICLVGIGLISQLGAPLTLARLSVIGNAIYESSAAELGAQALGTSISSPDYGPKAFTASVWVMSIGSALMLIMPMLFTKPMATLEQKIEGKDKGLGKIIGFSAALGSFGYFVSENVLKGSKYAISTIVAFISMIVFISISEKYKLSWLREWALGFSMIAGIVVTIIT